MKKIYSFVSLLLLCMPFFAHAQASDCTCPAPQTSQTPVIYTGLLRLSEALPDPADDEKEFIEIENLSSEALSLSAWILSDASNKKYIIANVTISAKGFVVIDKSMSGISLNNTGGETITLASPDGIVQDTLYYTGTTKKNWSYARTATGWSWTTTPTPGKANAINLPNTAPTVTLNIPKNIRANSDTIFTAEIKDADGDDVAVSWTFTNDIKKTGTEVIMQFASSGTKEVTVVATDERGLKTEKSATFSVAPFDVAENVLLNELYPKPKTGEVEWIEIVNTNDRAIALAGWQLTDGVTTFTFPDDATILANGFLAIDKTDTGISMNDTGDTITLIKPDAVVSDTITYDKATQGKSYAKLSSGWTWSDPTKGEANESTLPKVLGEAVFAQTPDEDTNLKTSASKFLQKNSAFSKYFPYAIFFLIIAGLGFLLFRKWRATHQKDEIELE